VPPLSPDVGNAVVGAVFAAVVEPGVMDPVGTVGGSDGAGEETAGEDAAGGRLWRGWLGVNPGGSAWATRDADPESVEPPLCWGTEPAGDVGL
jgi:hypothetical protein